MADIDRMFRSELALVAEQQSEPDIWAIDAPFAPPFYDLDIPDTPLGLFPAPTHSASSSSSAPLTQMSSDSDDLDLLYPSDSEYLPSPTAIDPASLSAPSTHPDILTHAPAIRPTRRGSRTISKVPVPVPNLTKKSRGRKVPTSNGDPIYAASRDKTKKGVRTYTCHADGCGKCFVRGEHLKRHIRSIHTDEKPWMCSYANCNRAFSRQDNLNQHVRTHKAQGGDADE